MKKVFVFLIILFFSCNIHYTDDNSNIVKENSIKTVVYDGCEYLMFITYGGVGVLSHKGNCSNPIHKCNCK